MVSLGGTPWRRNRRRRLGTPAPRGRGSGETSEPEGSRRRSDFSPGESSFARHVVTNCAHRFIFGDGIAIRYRAMQKDRDLLLDGMDVQMPLPGLLQQRFRGAGPGKVVAQGGQLHGFEGNAMDGCQRTGALPDTLQVVL